jgi:hypothetical protein
VGIKGLSSLFHKGYSKLNNIQSGLCSGTSSIYLYIKSRDVLTP